MRNELIDILKALELDKDVAKDMLVKLVYDLHKGNTMKLMLTLQKHEQDEQKQHMDVIYRGLESAVQNFIWLSRELMENKTKHKAMVALKTMYDKRESYSYLMTIARAYFPRGHAESHSIKGKWLFGMITEHIRNTGHMYIEGGEFYDWSKMNGHADYIKKVMKNLGIHEEGEDND